MIKKVFFDLDRTLWDFETNSELVLKELYVDFNLKDYIPSVEDFLNTYRQKNNALWALYRKGCLDSSVLKQKRFYETFLAYGIDKQELAQNFGKIYLEKLALKKQLFPGAIKLLNYLIEKYALYILTNGFQEVQIKKIVNIGLDKYFKQIFTSDTIGYQKPQPAFFEFVLKQVDEAPEYCIMIGDDLDTDIMGAKRCGIKGKGLR
ncbi:MAG TPA: noncanonical pyrimidine nucleotidase, YjjG family [Bacteroidales bacterium]|nr:noncanonical pyrimidine nucleotidase, YjjG family [Bacteroidales bacterium]